VSCRKDKAPAICESDDSETEEWEKFVGVYQVYDTLGQFLYHMDIEDYGDSLFSSGTSLRRLRFTNFADTFDFELLYSPINNNPYKLDIGFHDSISDQNHKSWHLSRKTGDPNYHNNLLNDTIVFYFKMTNIAYYINEAVPYYSCECKHVAVKQ